MIRLYLACTAVVIPLVQWYYFPYEETSIKKEVVEVKSNTGLIQENDKKIMDKVCLKAPNSPLCGNFELYKKLQEITYSKYERNSKIWEIMLGIAYAESHIGQNYSKDNAGGTCVGRNNWGGIKAKKLDDGRIIRDQNLPNEFNCWLYKFDSIEEYWNTKVNIITQGYKGCLDMKDPVKCISYNYVGNPKVAEKQWIRNVSVFLEN